MYEEEDLPSLVQEPTEHCRINVSFGYDSTQLTQSDPQ